MRIWLGFMVVALLSSLGGAAASADYKTLRNLNASPPTQVTPLPPSAKPRPVQFLRMVAHPADGEAWALAYYSISPGQIDEGGYQFLTWNGGRENEDTATFARAFDDEFAKAGFKAEASNSLFDEEKGSADLKVGVLIDDIKGRFCLDCPSFLNPKGIPASVVMTAHWEVYSTLERKVVARVTTTGGGDYQSKLGDSVMPAVLEGFRENVRQLLAAPEFRQLVTSGGASTPAMSPSPTLTPIALVAPKTHGSIAQASASVAVVYAADGSGSGFLVSSDGYVITNHHVVGGSKYVKLKWSDGSEELGEVIRSDARRDVALIKTDPHGRAPLALRLNQVRQGETVFAIGTPFKDAFQNTMTRGIVSAAERVVGGQRMIQSDVNVNHGNSGGPLVDESGAVIAITVSGYAPGGEQLGLNYFIPIDDALKALGLQPPA